MIPKTVTLCKNSFCFPQKFAPNENPLNSIDERIPCTTNSLATIRTTIQEYTKFPKLSKDRKNINDPHIKILSTRGSITLPMADSALYFLAIYPSKISVREAIKKIPSAISNGTDLSPKDKAIK
jgi:hypothetical protein